METHTKGENQLTNEEWEKEFDKEFVVNGGVMPKHRDFGQTLNRDLKTFISQLLQKREEETIQKIQDYASSLHANDYLEEYETIQNLISFLTSKQ